MSNTRKRFRKVMMRVGELHSPDGSIVITPERLSHWSREFNRMTSNGLAIPMHWDHSKEAENLKPILMSEMDEKKTRSAINSVGKMTGFDLASDGESAVITFETSDPKAADRLASNDVYVSPVILDRFADGAGQQYSDVITHLDIVNYPVDHQQSDSEVIEDEEALCCAIRMGLSTNLYRFAADTEPAGTPSQDSGTITVDASIVNSVIKQLAELGITLPEGTNADNFFERFNAALGVAITTLKDQTEMADQQQTSSDTNDSADTKVEQPNAQMMSLEAKAETAQKFAEKMHKDHLRGRLDSCLKHGRCSQAQYDNRLIELDAVKLSLDSEGNAQRCSLETLIGEYEEIPVGTFWDAKTKAERLQAEEPTKIVRFSADTTDNEINDDDAAAISRMAKA